MLKCAFCKKPSGMRKYCSAQCQSDENRLQYLLRKKAGKLKYPRAEAKK